MARRNYLEACCLVAKLLCPDAQDIIGIATETDLSTKRRSEDALYYNARIWTAENELEAKRIQKDFEVFTNPTRHKISEMEYPNVKLGRNDPCWCNSGKKFKRCHGR